MDLDWEKLVKRYVWNDERTPYFTRVANLTPRQAHYELFSYSVLVGVLCAVLAVAALASGLPHAEAVSLYLFSVCCAAILLGATRHPWPALWCAGAPLAALVYFALWGFPAGLEGPGKALVIAAAAAWLLYAGRVVAVTRTLA